MKKTLLVTTLALTSSVAMAQTPQCKLEINNEVHLKDNVVSVYQNNQPKVVIDKSNQLFINGDKVSLNSTQQKAVTSYREKISTYIPQAKEIADKGVKLASDVIDDVSDSFNDPNAFDNLKKSVDDYYAEIQSRYYNNGEWVLKKNAVSDAMANWKSDSATAAKRFNNEFFSSAFTALSAKMKEDGSVDLMALQTKLSELKNNVQTKLESQSVEIENEAKEYCGDLQGIAKDEVELRKQVPQLKDYEVFVI
ncbi:MAG: DUF2884 family protein [Vibrio sp.]